MAEALLKPISARDAVCKWLFSKSIDVRLEAAFSNFRVDFLADFPNFYLVVELDEDQHKKYRLDKESERTSVLVQKMSDAYLRDNDKKPFVVVRFNPDSYMHAEVRKNPTITNRIKFLDAYLSGFRPKLNVAVHWFYFCYDTDMFWNVLCPFATNHEYLEKNASVIAGDPDSFTENPIQQVLVEQRIDRKLEKFDARDRVIQSLARENNCLRGSLKRSRGAVDVTVDEDISAVEFDRTVPVDIKPAKLRKSDARAKSEGRGGIYEKRKNGTLVGYSIQFMAGGEQFCIHVPREEQINGGWFPVSNATLSAKALSFGLSEKHIARSFARLGR